jgi:hypothetical protein
MYFVLLWKLAFVTITATMFTVIEKPNILEAKLHQKSRENDSQEESPIDLV